jgi:hypothetical protein
MVFTRLPFAGGAAQIEARRRVAGSRIARVALALALALAAPGEAGAAEKGADEAPCGNPGHPWVKFAHVDTEHAPHGFDAIVTHVRAELALQQIDVCFDRAGAAPIATVQLTARSVDAVEVVIDVQDSLTKKRVSRVLDLRSGRARPATRARRSASWRAPAGRSAAPRFSASSRPASLLRSPE